MKNLIFFIGTFTLFYSGTILAEFQKKLTHESELGIVISQGNSISNTTSAKQLTSYKQSERNIYTLSAHYFYGKNAERVNARNWDVHLDFERMVNYDFSLFWGAGLEGDKFIGYEMRRNLDFGFKYYFINREKEKLFNEIGYRYQIEKRISGITPRERETHYIRDYFEYEKRMKDNLILRLGLEVLYDLKNSENYRFKGSPSFLFILTEHLSVKFSYEAKYQNVVTVKGKKKYDSLLMTSLVASF